MKVRKLYLAALLCAGLVGCSQSDDSIESFSQGEVGVKFNFETMATVANLDTRGAETTGETEEGTEQEWKVTNVAVYFFNAYTKAFSKCIVIDKLEKTSSAGKTIVYKTDTINVEAGLYDIFAVANSPKTIKAGNEKDFLNHIDSETYTTGKIEASNYGFVMSNRGNSNFRVEIKKREGSGPDQIIDITLERAVARLEIATQKEKYPLTDLNDQVYASITLDKCYYLNLPTKFYTFRHVATLTGLTQPTWDINTNFDDIPETNGYAIDPYFFNKAVNAAGFANGDGYYKNFACNLEDNENVAWSNITSSFNDNKIYSLENCMIQPAQKNGYSTGVLFKASITPNDNVYKEDGETVVKVSQEEYPDTLYYFNYNFYTSIQALQNAKVPVTADMSEDELLTRDIKIFAGKNGVFTCYYRYWIRHLDNDNPNVMGVMEFGIVRNNLYRMRVVDVSGLGSGKPDSDPDEPDEDETYIKVTLNVKPWIVRDNTNIIL